ncbi:MAG: hypothetical protein OWS74_07220, partial [Firmicutes bacterium]|nr:hypothetical protein [Bacillota bacterium]
VKQPASQLFTPERFLRLSIGWLWIFDGFLQLKPAMFTNAFVQQDLAGNLSGQPLFVQDLIHYGIGLWSVNDIASSLLAAAFKFGLGLLLVWPSRYAQRIGIVHTIVWGLTIWVFGEGFGMLLTPVASFATGSPGSVFFYVLIAFLLLSPHHDWPQLLRRLLIGLWTAAALWQARMLFFHPHALLPSLQQNQVVLPFTWMNQMVNAVMHLSQTHPVLLNAGLTAGFAVFAILWIFHQTPRAVFIAAGLWWFVLWAIGMEFGWGATTTDPNAAPLWGILLLAQYWSQKSAASTSLQPNAYRTSSPASP